MAYSVDGLDVILELLRRGLGPGVTVVSRLPDDVTKYMPIVLIHRTGGASVAPRFFDRYLILLQNWAGGPGSADPSRESFELAERCRGVLWEAVLQQHTTEAGWLVDMRESSAPQELPESDLPLYHRYVATYELKVRRPPLAA